MVDMDDTEAYMPAIQFSDHSHRRVMQPRKVSNIGDIYVHGNPTRPHTLSYTAVV